jgi:hypothetical protein
VPRRAKTRYPAAIIAATTTAHAATVRSAIPLASKRSQR